MGAPIGNVNAIKGKPWGDALRRALARREADNRPGLNAIADVLMDKALDGDMAALKELGDRLDGKAAQSIGGDPEGAPIKLEQVQRVIVDPRRDPA